MYPLPGLVVFRKLQSDAVKPERNRERKRERNRERERERGREREREREILVCFLMQER